MGISRFRALAVLVGLMALSACFGPNMSAAGSCESAGATIYATWKQVRGYPTNWLTAFELQSCKTSLNNNVSCDPVNPPKKMLEHHFRMMVIETGGQMCGVQVKNKGIDPNPENSTVFRADYEHDVAGKKLNIDYTYPSGAADQVVSYAITGCTTTPKLTLTFQSGKEAIFELWGSGGSCNNLSDD